MELTRTEDIAVHFLTELAANDNKGNYLSLSEFARNHGLSAGYLRKITRVLLFSGLIKSREGIKGGYGLVRKADEISVLDVMESVKSINRKVNHAGKDLNSSCPLQYKCMPQKIRNEINTAVKNSLGSIKLTDFL